MLLDVIGETASEKLWQREGVVKMRSGEDGRQGVEKMRTAYVHYPVFPRAERERTRRVDVIHNPAALISLTRCAT